MIERDYKRSKKKKQYRAVVIDMHKIFKIFVVGIMIIVILLFMAIGVRSFGLSSNKNSEGVSSLADANKIFSSAQNIENNKSNSDKNDDSKNENNNKKNNKEINNKVETDNPNNKKIGEHVSHLLKNLCGIVIGFSTDNLSEAVAIEVPGSENVNTYQLVREASDNPVQAKVIETPAPTEAIEENSADMSSIKAINAGQNANNDTNFVKIGNQTSYSVNIDEMLSENLKLDMSGDGPKVLIVHTHATEAYTAEGAQKYNRKESDRSMELDQNVVAVGEELTKLFKEKGIDTLHDKTLHDYPSFNGSYAHSLSAIEWYKSEYPSIQIVFDLHRDSIVYDDGTKAKVVTKIDGKNAAQLMFVVGTNQKGLYHPNWNENIKFAIQLQDKIDQKYPNLMRYVNLRQERFNGHTTFGSVIIEVGSSGNSLNEAKYGIKCAGEVIADFLNEL